METLAQSAVQERRLAALEKMNSKSIASTKSFDTSAWPISEFGTSRHFAAVPNLVRCKRPWSTPAQAQTIRRRGAPLCSSDDFDDAHHALVFVIDCMTMVDKPTDDYGISERNDDLEHARPLVRCRRY